MAAMLAPKSPTGPEVPFHMYQAKVSFTGIESPPPSPEESALGVLAQVAHELDGPLRTSSGNYFNSANILPQDLSDTLLQTYLVLSI
jgi:hypothetical protein